MIRRFEIIGFIVKHCSCYQAGTKNIPVDLYFSHPDWYDADFRPYHYHPLTAPDMVQNPQHYYNSNTYGSNKRKTILTPEETARMVKQHREQLDELLSNYGEVNMLCLDQWLGKDNWKDLKKTMK